MKNVLAKLDEVLWLLREAKQGICSSYNVENEHDIDFGRQDLEAEVEVAK